MPSILGRKLSLVLRLSLCSRLACWRLVLAKRSSRTDRQSQEYPERPAATAAPIQHQTNLQNLTRSLCRKISHLYVSPAANGAGPPPQLSQERVVVVNFERDVSRFSNHLSDRLRI